MEELGVAPNVIERCLIQKSKDRIVETYQRAELVSKQKRAFNRLGEYLSKIAEG